MTTYINPWHKPGKPEYGPTKYETNVKPTEYKGFLIYNRIQAYNLGGGVWAVVQNGHCVTQRAGINGAKSYIDELNS